MPTLDGGPVRVDDAEFHALRDTLHRLMNGEHKDSSLRAEADGWFPLAAIQASVSVALERDIGSQQLMTVVRRTRRMELLDGRIRLHKRQKRRKRQRPTWTPDILFHATTDGQLDRQFGPRAFQRAQDGQKVTGRLSAGAGRYVFLSADEDQAWMAAHRLRGTPRVLAIDTARARRSGVRMFQVRKGGLYRSTDIPVRHVLTLRPGFGEQLSAGGIPIRVDSDGTVRMALIQVSRRSGVTWEVAKGKLEPGESPRASAVREVCEEMGVDVEFDILRPVGDVRYGFLAPGGAPRLKTIFLFLLRARSAMGDFSPSTREGIGAVQWFTVDEAVAAVTHSSLRPMMVKARELIKTYGVEQDPSEIDPSLG